MMRELSELQQRRVFGGCDAELKICGSKSKRKQQLPPPPSGQRHSPHHWEMPSIADDSRRWQ